MFPRGHTHGAQIAFFVGIAFLIFGGVMLVQLQVFPPFRSGVYVGNLFGGLLFLFTGVSLTVGALVRARPSEDEAQ